MSIPKNTWYCSVCDFYVFNTKPQCNKCAMKRPKTKSYDIGFDEKICDYFQQTRLEEKTTCIKCKNEGRIFNKDPMKSNHNCWKYS